MQGLASNPRGEASLLIHEPEQQREDRSLSLDAARDEPKFKAANISVMLVEFALLLCVITIAAIALYNTVFAPVTALFSKINSALTIADHYKSP